MASVVVKTIWQSKEFHQAGDTPARVERRIQLGPEAPGSMTGPAKGVRKKKKAVSFHRETSEGRRKQEAGTEEAEERQQGLKREKIADLGEGENEESGLVEPRTPHEPVDWCLNLRRSSGCTNVSLLNLAAAVEPWDSSGTNCITEDSGPLELPGPPAAPAPPWAADDPDIKELLSGLNSGLVHAKDSVISLKEKTSWVNQHVQTLQSECSLLSENLERRRQEAEELEGYCSQLKENCKKVTRSVEDAEIKTNVLKQNSALLEEKLRYLQQELQDETPRQEVEMQELEQKLEASLSHSGLSGNPEEAARLRSTAPGGCGTGPGAGETPHTSEQELQKVSASLEDLRREVSSLAARWHQEEGAVQEALRLLGGLGGRLDGFMGQWERAQCDQTQTARSLQELRRQADQLCTLVERSAVSLASLRSELEGLGPVKPILEELARQFRNSQRVPDHSMNPDRSSQGSCARCASQGQQLSMESLQHLLERALTPLVDEVKQRNLTPPACPSCQRLHKKILELERQALAKHIRAEALSSTLRLAQDEALRAKNLLLTDKMKPEEKVATLDYLHLKMCSLHDQLSNLPLEGSTGTMGEGSGGAAPKCGSPAPKQ
ncbi:testis-specific serine kinase substrate isoform X2 [Heterocephalus glaber]|uniref:Testis-specific serine kinase substrate isoform X2 n=2 Tax=Heterocephalus glaber TaxID=10181 RepID=A0AAX6Q3P7_HETGA|nr:testis-specific serine kinase substrate isoform X2 [Heterocephalus glaber]